MNCKKRYNWHVYSHEQELKIWDGGELIATIPQKEFPHMILQMAKALKENVGNDDKS